jgi:hypothetical protein
MTRTCSRVLPSTSLALVLASSPAVAQEALAPPPAAVPVAAPMIGPAVAPTPLAAASAPTASSVASSTYSGLPNSPARFGLGLTVGNMVTGLTAKLWAAATVALQAALGESALGNNVWARLDMAFSPGTWTSADGQYVLPVYIAIGGVIGHDFAVGQIPSSTEGGFRLPLGMSVLVRGNPVELFFEIAPEFTVRSISAARGKYGFYTDGSIGARYYF